MNVGAGGSRPVPPVAAVGHQVQQLHQLHHVGQDIDDGADRGALVNHVGRGVPTERGWPAGSPGGSGCDRTPSTTSAVNVGAGGSRPVPPVAAVGHQEGRADSLRPRRSPPTWWRECDRNRNRRGNPLANPFRLGLPADVVHQGAAIGAVIDVLADVVELVELLDLVANGRNRSSSSTTSARPSMTAPIAAPW